MEQMVTKETSWGEVTYQLTLDGGKAIKLVLDGAEYTTECLLSPICALRLGQALIEIARKSDLPLGTVEA